MVLFTRPWLKEWAKCPTATLAVVLSLCGSAFLVAAYAMSNRDGTPP
jgi:hypothetical protein